MNEPDLVLLPFIENGLLSAFWSLYGTGDMPPEKNILWSLISKTAELAAIDVVLILDGPISDTSSISEGHIERYENRAPVERETDTRWITHAEGQDWKPCDIRNLVASKNVNRELTILAKKVLRGRCVRAQNYRRGDKCDGRSLSALFTHLKAKHLILSPIILGESEKVVCLFSSKCYDPSSVDLREIGADIWANVVGQALGVAVELYAIAMALQGYDQDDLLSAYKDARKSNTISGNLNDQRRLLKSRGVYVDRALDLYSKGSTDERKRLLKGVSLHGRYDLVLADYVSCVYMQICMECGADVQKIEPRLGKILPDLTDGTDPNRLTIRISRSPETDDKSGFEVQVDTQKCPETTRALWLVTEHLKAVCAQHVTDRIGKFQKQLPDPSTSDEPLCRLCGIQREWSTVRCEMVRCVNNPAGATEDTARKLIKRIFGGGNPLAQRTVSVLLDHLFNRSNGGSPSPMGDVGIDTQWLAIWFAAYLLSSGEMKQILKRKCDRLPASAVSLVRLVDILSLYVLECCFEIVKGDTHEDGPLPIRDLMVPESPEDGSITDAQIIMMAEYAYEALGVPRSLHLEEELGSLFSPQLLLYGLKRAYRDHLFHVIDVCLLGHLLMEISVGKKTQEKKIGELLFGNEWKKSGRTDILRNWYVAAMMHDMGYVIQLATQGISAVQFLSGLDDYFKNINEGLQRGTEDFKRRFEAEPFIPQVDRDRLKKSLGKLRHPLEDHGIVGACHLHAKLDALDEGGICVEKFKTAIYAVALHELPYAEMQPNNDPLAFLLFLCDKLQEWGRPRIDSLDLARRLHHAIRMDEHVEFAKSRTVRCLWLNLSYDDENGTIHYRLTDGNRSIVLLLEHNNPSDSGAEPVPGWIKLLYEFGKIVDLGELPDIVVMSYHPVETDDSRVTVPNPQVQLLDDYAHSNTGGFACRMIDHIEPYGGKESGKPRKAYVANKPLSYAAGNCAGPFEQIAFVLSRMNKGIPPLDRIQILGDSYYSDFLDWKSRRDAGKKRKRHLPRAIVS